MPSECSNCGGECEKSGGRYRELCPTCIREKAQIVSHGEQCEQNECIVCGDKLGEMQEVVQPLFVRTLLEQDREPNKSLQEYT